jgi:hypothetical protein
MVEVEAGSFAVDTPSDIIVIVKSMELNKSNGNN